MMPLALSMFGRQVLDVHEFHLHNEDGSLKKDANGNNELNWDAMNTDEGKTVVWKHLAMMKMASDFFAHRVFRSPYTKYDFRIIEEAYEALERISANIALDEDDLQKTFFKGTFFGHHDIGWMKKISGTTSMKLLMTDGGLAALGGAGTGFMKGMGATVKNMFSNN